MNVNAINADTWLNIDGSRMLMAEEYIFSAAIHDYDFWLMAAERLCVDPVNHRDIDDFDRVERNIIFTALRKLYNMCEDQSDEQPKHTTHPEVLKDFLTREASSGNLCSEDEIAGVIEFYTTSLDKVPKDDLVIKLAKKFLPIWLSRKRRQYIATTTRNMSIDQMLSVSELHSDAVSSITANHSSLFLFGNHPRNEDVEPGIKLLSLPNLTNSLGDLHKGDSYLVQAPSGGGKTVLACQILLDFISQGKKGLFISTEQPWKEIEPRLISNACDIPITVEFLRNHFNHKMAVQMHPASRIEDIERWEESVKHSFVFAHWNTDNSQSVRTDLEATYRRAKNLFKCDPDFVILDWIGGALGSDINSDNLRFAYQDTADAFASATQTHKFVGIAFAQSKADKTYFSLGSEQLAECKTMHRKFTGLIGITAITRQDDKKQSNPTETKYQDDQFIDVAKSRKGEAARIRVVREFKYQRFKEYKII